MAQVNPGSFPVLSNGMLVVNTFNPIPNADPDPNQFTYYWVDYYTLRKVWAPASKAFTMDKVTLCPFDFNSPPLPYGETLLNARVLKDDISGLYCLVAERDGLLGTTCRKIVSQAVIDHCGFNPSPDAFLIRPSYILGEDIDYTSDNDFRTEPYITLPPTFHNTGPASE